MAPAEKLADDSQGGEIKTNSSCRVGLIVLGLFFAFFDSTPLYADTESRELWIDGGTGFTLNGTGAKNSDISVAIFARYRVIRWEIHAGGWHSSEGDVSNITLGAGYVFTRGSGLNFTAGLAIADKSANIGTHGRFYLAPRFDFQCWSIGYVHYSNGDSILNHDRTPNEGVNLIVAGRKLRGGTPGCR